MIRVIFLSAILLLSSFDSISAEPDSSNDKKDIIQKLLEFPAPPPESGESAVFTEDSPPPEDAPLDVLGRYWAEAERYSTSKSYGNKGDSDNELITMKTRERLVDACIANPEIAPSILDLLPQTPEVMDILKDLYNKNADNMDVSWKKELKNYLKKRSKYFRKELIADASSVKDDDSMGMVSKGDELKALAVLDWDAAEPILNKFSKEAMTRRSALSKTLLYNHYISQNEKQKRDKLHFELKGIVENKNEFGYSRDIAAEALFSSEWVEREKWFISLFKDSSFLKLRDGNAWHSVLHFQVRKEPDHLIPIVSKLVGDTDQVVHDNAVDCLIQFQLEDARRDALIPLLPWLMDPNWSNLTSTRERLRLIQSVAPLDIKESIPGLIAVLNQDVDEAERAYAADALTHFRDKRAISELRRGMPTIKRSHYRRMFISALVASGGLSDDEAANAVEAYAEILKTEEGRKIIEDTYISGEVSFPIPVSIGQYLVEREMPSESVISLLLTRAEKLKNEDYKLSEIIKDFIHRWPSAVSDHDIFRMIINGTASEYSIAYALERRDLFSKNCSIDIMNAGNLMGTAAGILAVLSGDKQKEIFILESKDFEAQRALLACARLVREPLPIEHVERLYMSNNQLIKKVALAYLMTEDSPKARQVISKNSKTVFIVGARQAGEDPGHYSNSEFDQIENELLELMSGDNKYDELYAMLTAGYWGDSGQILIGRRGDVATLSFYDDSERKYSRVLKQEEYEQFFNFIKTEKIDDLGPLNQDIYDGMQYEYIHITQNMGRRVYMNNPGMSDSAGSVYDRLCALFSKLQYAEKLTLEYPELKKLSGFKILIADHRFHVLYYWKDKKTECLMIDPWRDSQSSVKAFSNLGILKIKNSLPDSENPFWTSIINEKIIPVSAPQLFPLENPGSVVPRDFDEKNYDRQPRGVWRLSKGPIAYRVGYSGDKKGFWKFVPGAPPKLLVEGNILSPVLSNDGKWALLAKNQGSWAEPNIIVQVNLSTGVLTPIDIPEADTLDPIVYIAERKEFLAFRDKDEPYDTREPVGPEKPEFWLIDPETGKTEVTGNEIRPLLHLGHRPLQRSKSGQYWAAVPADNRSGTNIGLYNAELLKFTPIQYIPGLRLNSMDIWIDENQKVIYIVYQDQLLQLSLSQ